VHLNPSERCQRARMLCSLLLDGELDPLRERELRQHLSACASCASVAHEYEALTTLLRMSPRAAPDRPLHLRAPRRAASLRSSLLAAAIIGLAATIGLTGLSGSPSSTIPAHRTRAFVSNVVAISASDPNRVAVLSHRVSV
jgi:anti-sigma factor RsiW